MQYLIQLIEEKNGTDVKEFTLSWSYETALFFLSRGKFAVVRQCISKSTGQEYAAKFLKKRRRGQDCRAEILHEIAVLELARACPHVINLHEVYETATEIILVLE